MFQLLFALLLGSFLWQFTSGKIVIIGYVLTILLALTAKDNTVSALVVCSGMGLMYSILYANMEGTINPFTMICIVFTLFSIYLTISAYQTEEGLKGRASEDKPIIKYKKSKEKPKEEKNILLFYKDILDRDRERKEKLAEEAKTKDTPAIEPTLEIIPKSVEADSTPETNPTTNHIMPDDANNYSYDNYENDFTDVDDKHHNILASDYFQATQEKNFLSTCLDIPESVRNIKFEFTPPRNIHTFINEAYIYTQKLTISDLMYLPESSLKYDSNYKSYVEVMFDKSLIKIQYICRFNGARIGDLVLVPVYKYNKYKEMYVGRISNISYKPFEENEIPDEYHKEILGVFTNY